MRVTWAVQTNLLNAQDVGHIERACHDQGHLFVPLVIIPFSEELPDIPSDVPTIFYGSARQTITIARSKRWRPGVFFDEATFCYSAYCEHLGTRMLNHDALRLSARQLAAIPESVTSHTTYFVRPNGDDKAFAGTLMTGDALTTWAKRLIEIDAEMDLDAPMVIAPPKPIHMEWRLFMCGTQVISGSRYRTQGDLDVSDEVPGEVIKFASQSAACWHPAQAFVMDIASLMDGSLHIIEFNGINSSGFYMASIPKIIATLSGLAQKPYQ